MRYLVLDAHMGAFQALKTSARITGGQKWSLAKLDLHFWWFYGLEALISILCYGDLLLPLLGVDLGMNGTLASFVFYALALACQIGLYAWQKPRIMASYALFYHDLLPKEPPEETQVEA